MSINWAYLAEHERRFTSRHKQDKSIQIIIVSLNDLHSDAD